MKKKKQKKPKPLSYQFVMKGSDLIVVVSREKRNQQRDA